MHSLRLGRFAGTLAIASFASLVGIGGCGSSKSNGFGDGDASAGDGSAGDDGGLPIDALSDQFAGCATGNFQAHQSPAALLIDLDRSGTMASNNKFAFAQQAIVAAIDQDPFDTMTLGLMAFPSGSVAAPQCVINDSGGLVTSVACAAPGLPQVALSPAGMNKSNASSGVRHDIYAWLTTAANAPVTDGTGDGNPTYDALENAIGALKLVPNVKRILFYVTDGGASCTAVSNRSGYLDKNMPTACADWEHPDAIVTMLKNAHDDPTTPVNTFVVGVPGADGDGNTTANPNIPPYHVRNALSAYAYAGSPETVDAACTGKVYAQTGPDPAVSCHFDMSQNYSAQRLVDALNLIRGKVLGCIFELPKADGGTVDPNKVNVTYTVNGMTIDLKKRSDPNDMCLMDGCWDYTPDGKVELFGKACSDVKGVATAQVKIVVGCSTIIK